MSLADDLSFQLYSSRKLQPFEAQLRMLSGLGYRKVEPYGALLNDIDALEAGLKKFGLSAPSLHADLDSLRRDLDGLADKARRLDCGLIVIPYLGSEARPTNAEDWRALGREVAALRARLSGRELRLAWHNHDFELSPLPDGSIPLNILLESDPELHWEADIGWIARTGADPLTWIERHFARIAAFHLKDAAPSGAAVDEDGWADIGAGIIDWERLTPVMRRSPAWVYIVEHDDPSDPERFARASRAAVAAWSF